MASEAYVPSVDIAQADDETRHLTVVEDIKLPPGAEATQAFVKWALENPFWLIDKDTSPRVDYHAEGADWVYQYRSVGQQAVAGATSGFEAA